MARTVINGKKYDTETAKLIDRDYDHPVNDFNHWDETLYRKKTGEFFIHGRGGPMSKYSKPAFGGGVTGSSKFIPLTNEQARHWMENHSTVEKIEEIFGEIPE